MPSCKFFIFQEDGVHGWCKHPESQPCDTCILDENDECVLRKPIMTSMQVSADTLEALRGYGYPAEKAIKKLLDIAEGTKRAL